MSSILKVDEIQNTTGKTGLVITPDGTVTVPSVKFPEQSNPSGRVITSTTMSSYEEGTWTPVFKNIGTGTYQIQVGSYVKIGHLVTIQCHLKLATSDSSALTLVVGGLPFKSSDISGLYGTSSHVHGTGWATPRNSLSIILAANTNETNPIYHDVASRDTTCPTHGDLYVGSLVFSMTYRTDE